MDALQIVVRGFATQDMGNEIIRDLSELGFSVKFKADANADSKGGIIETTIEEAQEIDTDQLTKFRAKWDDKPALQEHWTTAEVIGYQKV